MTIRSLVTQAIDEEIHSRAVKQNGSPISKKSDIRRRAVEPQNKMAAPRPA